MLAIALPFICQGDFFKNRASIQEYNIVWLMPVYYAFCVPALVALFSLDRLLAAVRRNEVFTAGNVRWLRIISWCCLLAAAVLLVSSLVSVVFPVLAILAAFFGVVLRVVKNLFAAAVDLKTDNDFTI
ncbi:MAG: DUF2975 domain-containing protein [Coriobacteriales bacterium]|jgi:hypothetical protein|nr:DUF2975 domain-containing protein [Coriobacteriales bacterium]